MGERLLDVAVSAAALLLLLPLLLVVAIAIKCASPGDVLYRAPRVGRGGRTFVMHKFRTMRTRAEPGSVITAAADARVFPVGRILRVLKIDELPQLYDVLVGEMSIVGPRPEDPKIVERFYGPLGWTTLEVKPGLLSPGSLYTYTHGDRYVADRDPELSYVRTLLPVKLALEAVFVRRDRLPYRVRLMLRTLVVVTRIALGRRDFPDPPEMAEARALLAALRPEPPDQAGETYIVPAVPGPQPANADRTASTTWSTSDDVIRL